MLQRLTAYLLIVSVVSANFSRFFVYAGFELNKGYIAAKLCENRNKPQLHCNGKCYFMKKVKQAEEKQNTDDRQAQKNLFQEANCNQPATVKFYAVLLSVTKVPNYRIQLPQQMATIFQPPRLA
ncbi:hypothetical protein [Mucilaginibacter phyllosphaerae]|uniref:Secreted protein n=1 Tax=Mucilaginibacter phyllosphaerae TaxID=1812349 RepID=A0A4Y8AH64_9SPHI|nr:hypothetical protein [Mucilaginibacter phyllosphaerae]MBB3968811.1 hypothetical protein [Mucilaginibacter phyllosphaerae]TEW67555.1 hypothetical protein E2R65_06085 [Mucilaginibacter phyllosphaerae]GGH13746.1 hypothetical protein GCM10007352_21400 [Mucilaginibacter phyllosphaerae]